MVTAAERRLAGFKSLKEDIDTDMAKIHEISDDVRTKIRENILSNENRDGLLTNKQEDYLKCQKWNTANLSYF